MEPEPEPDPDTDTSHTPFYHWYTAQHHRYAFRHYVRTQGLAHVCSLCLYHRRKLFINHHLHLYDIGQRPLLARNDYSWIQH